MKRRGFLQLLGLSAVAPEVLAKKTEYDVVPVTGQTEISFPPMNEGGHPVTSPNKWEPATGPVVLDAFGRPPMIFGESTIELDHGASQAFYRVQK